MLKIVLDGEKNDAGAAGNRKGDQINREEQCGAACPAHQHPDGQQHDVVPEHMPVLFGRLPVACFKAGGMLAPR